VANPLPLVGLPSNDLTLVSTTTFSMTNEDAEYPAENLGDGDPANTAKSTTNTTTITITTSSASVVIGAIINTNATTVTINGVTVTIPAVELDGQRIHGWLDRRTTPLGPATTWTIVLTRPTGVVWVGAIPLLTAVSELNLRYGLEMGRRRPGDTAIPTRMGSIMKHPADIRTRWAKGEVNLIENETLLKQHEASAEGFIGSFLFIPDEATNDAWYVSYAANDFKWGYPDYDVRPIPLAFEELSGGPPNG
jgi:hypothetical protein